ncbi:MAG TPA: cyanophycin synthetase, partial [Planctomycetaceae bacterium]|nr:cyanophycin synthetase [Planctomycetaceae bacterium]
LVGRHNISNCLAAAAVAERFGLSLEQIARGIAGLRSIPGRLERIDGPQPFEVFVDYAHTEDALRNAVRFLNRLTRGRVICVFGAGGDRDRSKRPLLGRAAAEADLAVVTSDNPRSEHPERIIRDILPGLTSAGRRPYIEPDRAQAIRWALDRAEPGDSVLIAGKGHETEQIIGNERLPFDDREVVRRSLVPPPHFLRIHSRVETAETVLTG